MPLTLQYQVIDAFTTKPFSGNPAAVIVLEHPLPEAAYLPLAIEFNLSETAFLVPLEPTDEYEYRYSLRWFTPAVEIALCGHATLASAHVLFEKVPSSTTTLAFETLSGTLIAKKLAPLGPSSGGGHPQIQLDFPADEGILNVVVTEGREYDNAVAATVAASPALRGKVVQVGVATSMGPCVEVEEGVDLPSLPFDAKAIQSFGYKMLTLTQKAPGSDYDVFSRFFGPGVGVDEDPTGSAHCYIGPYWLGTSARSRLDASRFSAGELEVRCRQVSKRDGDVLVSWDKETSRIKLVGGAVSTMKGEVVVP